MCTDCILEQKRIPRYSMMLGQLAKHAFLSDVQTIRRAEQHIVNITDYINEKKREAEDLEIVCKETKKIHIKSGKAVVCCNKCHVVGSSWLLIDY
jgi:hypothetical protein